MSTLRFNVGAMRPDLAPHVEKSVESVPHVQSVHVDLNDSCVLVEHDGADPREIAAALKEEGFDAKQS
jgi:copper chaperone CopZ